MGLPAWKQRDQKGVCSSLRRRAVAGLGFWTCGGARGNRRQSYQEAGCLAYGA